MTTLKALWLVLRHPRIARAIVKFFNVGRSAAKAELKITQDTLEENVNEQ